MNLNKFVWFARILQTAPRNALVDRGGGGGPETDSLAECLDTP